MSIPCRKEIIGVINFPPSKLFWIFTFSAILLILVLVFPNWGFCIFLSEFVNYIKLLCIGTFLLLIINLIISQWKKIKIKRDALRKVDQLLEDWLEVQRSSGELKINTEISEVQTDTNSMEFNLGAKGLYQDITIYHLDSNQQIMCDFSSLLSKTKSTIEMLSTKFPHLENYIKNINSIYIHSGFKTKLAVEEYFTNMIKSVISSLKSIKKEIL